MLQIFWFTIVVGMLVVCLSYMKIRERIPFAKRNKLEGVAMVIIIILLVVNVFTIVYERRNISLEMNDCIRFYKEFPGFYDDGDFHFVNKWCYKYFTEEDIVKMRKSGLADEWRDFGNILDLNFTGG